MVASLAARRETQMATKNTRGGSSKTAPAKSLKEKRLDKKAKRSAKAGVADESLQRADR